MSRSMSHFWLVKQEPTAYSWEQFVADGKIDWTGVRNFQARNNLRAMKQGDEVLYYHSVNGKAVVGIAEVSKEAFRDPTSAEGDWVAVELIPKRSLYPGSDSRDDQRPAGAAEHSTAETIAIVGRAAYKGRIR